MRFEFVTVPPLHIVEHPPYHFLIIDDDGKLIEAIDVDHDLAMSIVTLIRARSASRLP